MNQKTPISLLALLCFLFFSFARCQAVFADEFAVTSAETKVQNGAFYVDADIQYVLSEQVEDALINGVPIQFSVDVEIVRIRSWLWDSKDVEKTFSYLLKYRALAKHYQLVNLTTQRTTHFKSLRRALNKMGKLRDLPLAKIEDLVRKEHYNVRLRAKLDVEALPLPLQPTAYFSSDWALSSQWFVWRLDI